MKPNSFRQKFFYSFGQVGNGVYNGLNNGILGLYVSAFTSNAFIIGYVSNTRTVEGAIIQPLVGKLSDRTRSPLGRRRPFILFGIPISVFFLSLVPILSHSSHNLALPLIITSIVLFSITWNIAGDPYQALMVDITPREERATFNAILSVLSLMGQVAILLYAAFTSINKHNIPDGVFYACVVCLFVTYALVFFGVREPREAATAATREEHIPWRTYIEDLKVFKEANKLLISIFCLWTGLNAVIPYLTVYTKKVMHVDNHRAIIIYLIVILASGIAAYPFGRLGARFGSRRMIVVGTALLIVAAIGGTIAPTYAALYPVAILAGVGFAATTVLTYPYLSELVPGSKIGVFTGLQASFASIAVPLSTGLTALFITFFGYRSIFVMLAGMMAVDIVMLLSIDEHQAEEQVTRVEEGERRLAGTMAPAIVS
jgi:maltose/moltooligosaccharide transporter